MWSVREKGGETHNKNKNKNIEQEQRHGGPAGYLGKRARVQNQRLCHWGRSIGGDLRSVSGASSSSGRGGGSGGLQGREKHNTQSLSPPLRTSSQLRLAS